MGHLIEIAKPALFEKLDFVSDVQALSSQLTGMEDKASTIHLKRVASGNILVVAFELGSGTERIKIVGMGTLSEIVVPTSRFGLISDLASLPDFAEKGIGAEVMHRLLTEAKIKRLDYVDLTSDPEREAANKLYLSLGFERRESNPYRLYLPRGM